MKHIVILLLMTIPTTLTAQEDVRSFVMTLLEDYAAEQDAELTEDDDLIAMLMELYDNPIDLNTATRQQLEALPFLSDFQIENLLAHIYINGPMQQIYELSAVDGFSPEDIGWLTPFVSITTIPSIQYRSKLVKGASLARVSLSRPKPIGYYPANDTSAAPYLGHPVKLLQKSELKIGNSWHIGYLVENDAGEPMFAHVVKAFDFMSAFGVYKPAKGVVRQVVVGDYSARFGQGLGMWTGFSMGMTSENTSLRRRASGLTRYNSSGESAFLRGTAIDLKKGSHSLSLFASYKPVDATTTSADTIGTLALATIRNTGLHATKGELEGRHAANETLAGGYYQFGGNSFRAGAGAAHWEIDKPLLPSTSLYRKYYFSGNSMNSVFADYRLFLKGIHLYGEVAAQNMDNIAVTQGADIRPGGGVELTLAYRYFDRRYTPLFQQPYSRSSSPGGESGIYGAVKFQPTRKVTVTTAVNYQRFDWLRYRVSAPSSGFDYYLWIRFNPDYSNRLLMRYKYNEGEQDKGSTTANAREINGTKRHTLNIQWQHKASDLIDFQTIAAFARYTATESPSSSGYWISQDARARIPLINLTLQLRLAHFDTDNYDSRIYIYEPDILYAFSVPARSGNGLLASLNAGWKITKSLQFWSRIQHVYRRDADKSGSGYNTVDSPYTTEMKFQIKYLF